MKNLPDKAIIAMIHTLPLPGSSSYGGDMNNIINKAIEELKIYEEAGVDAIMLENMHDVPYIKPPLPKNTVEGMLKIATEIRKRTNLPVGLQMLEAANLEAITIAAKANFDFIRAEGFVFAHIGGAGLIEGSAGALLRLRNQLKADHIKVFADVKKKHCAHALTTDLGIKGVVKQTDFFRADGIIITGGFTGEAAKLEDLAEARNATRLPIFIGSGITPENINTYVSMADGFIVGSYFKIDGKWQNPVDPKHVKDLLRAAGR